MTLLMNRRNTFDLLIPDEVAAVSEKRSYISGAKIRKGFSNVPVTTATRNHKQRDTGNCHAGISVMNGPDLQTDAWPDPRPSSDESLCLLYNSREEAHVLPERLYVLTLFGIDGSD